MAKSFALLISANNKNLYVKTMDLVFSIILLFVTLTIIIDAGIVFVLRHIMIDLFNHKLDTASIYAFSVLLLALGAICVATSINFQRENTESHHSGAGEPDIPR